MTQLAITQTGKGYSPRDQFQIFDRSTKLFPTIRKAKSYLKETYGNCKRARLGNG